MLTVASPKVGEVELALRAREIRAGIKRARETAAPDARTHRVSLVTLFPQALGIGNVLSVRDGLAQLPTARKIARDVRDIDGNGFAGLDANIADGAKLREATEQFISD